jgi:SAM-dependent methyltransferase
MPAFGFAGKSAMLRTFVLALAVLAGGTPTAVPAGLTSSQQPVRQPDVIFIPSSDAVVDAMLKIAKVTRADLVYDLGCGDGKIVIAAAKQYGARGVGIDIDPQRIKEANDKAKAAGVTDKVRFVLGDIFSEDVTFSDATVVTLYLLPSLNERLRPRLWRDLKPGTRVVSNSFSMSEKWPPEQTQQVGDRWIYFWTIPSGAR